MSNLTLAQMHALLADNSSGQISATDMRDVVQALFERTDGTTAIPALKFDTTSPDPINAAGTLYWNSAVGTLDVDVATDGTLQVGQEQYIIGRNTTGATILNGRVVQISGGQGDQTLVSLSAGQGLAVGVTTEDIANNSTGRITTFGIVHDLNTSAFNDGDRVYSSGTGTLTTSPSGSFVGVILNANANAGTVLVFPFSFDNPDGTTAARPAVRPTGYMYFDSTLGIPIWWSGANWVNASGATV